MVRHKWGQPQCLLPFKLAEITHRPFRLGLHCENTAANHFWKTYLNLRRLAWCALDIIFRKKTLWCLVRHLKMSSKNFSHSTLQKESTSGRPLEQLPTNYGLAVQSCLPWEHAVRCLKESPKRENPTAVVSKKNTKTRVEFGRESVDKHPGL